MFGSSRRRLSEGVGGVGGWGGSGDKGDPASVNIQDSDVSGRGEGGDKGAAGVHLKSGLAPR